MNMFTNPIECSLLQGLVDLYVSDLEHEVHSYRHLQCLSCSKRAVVNILTRHQKLIGTRLELLTELVSEKS